MTDWIILRTAVQSTFRLATSLTEAGYQAWSPAVARVWRERESRTRKSETVPGTPGYVFAKADRLHDLLALSRSPSLGYMKWDTDLQRMVSRGHPAFTLMPDHDSYAYVTEQELSHLRREERRGRTKEQTRPFLVGEHVKVIDGPFQGMVGEVLGVFGLHVQIEFPRSIHLPKIPRWMLQHVEELEKAA